MIFGSNALSSGRSLAQATTVCVQLWIDEHQDEKVMARVDIPATVFS